MSAPVVACNPNPGQTRRSAPTDLHTALEIELRRDLHHAWKVSLALRQGSKRANVVDVQIGAGTNRSIGDVERLPTEQEFVALRQRPGLGEGQIQLRLLLLADVRESVRSRSHVKPRKLLVATPVIVEPVILILFGRLPRAAIVSKIRPADRVPVDVTENPIEVPIVDDRSGHRIADVEPAALAEGQIPNAVDTEVVGLVRVVKFVDRLLGRVPIVQTMILLEGFGQGVRQAECQTAAAA